MVHIVGPVGPSIILIENGVYGFSDVKGVFS